MHEKPELGITKTVFLPRIISLWVNYLSWPHTHYLAIRKIFDKHSLRTKGLFHLSQMSGAKVYTPLVFCILKSEHITWIQQNWNLHNCKFTKIC